ncbi:MAG: hydantoinase/oxoprolinase family protein [Actinomycetota bacterium]|nr:hydantoinase/oxoprolinase family protein [Actinomycetota bacterium]
MPKIIGVDVGGTFTDVVEFDGQTIRGTKVPTSKDQSDGVVDAVDGTEDDTFLHGTTAATNALLEGRGAGVVLVTDAGYEDLIEIGRQDRPSLYDSSVLRSPPLVSRERRISHIDSGVLATADAVAVGLIESYLDPSAERELAAAIGEQFEGPIMLSSEVSPEFREFERIATTVLSAYLTPSVSDYLRTLDQRLVMSSRLVMTSSGGLLPFAQAPNSAGRLVLSGPAGGAVAAAALGRHYGHDTVLSFDMGGTSTDVSRISNGELTVGSGHLIAGRVNRVPSVPIRTIGAGGGSIGWLDPGGALRVGPRSAGSIPGPAGYGRGGTDPTVTDANILAGRIPSDLALGGTVGLDVDAARAAMGRLGSEAGLDVDATAHGMLEVVDSHMEHALRSVSVEEGADPREAVLVAFGGAGGLHAVRLARRLGMSRVLIPPHSGVFSALGLLMASPRSDAARTVMLSEGDQRFAALAAEVCSEATGRYEGIFASAPLSVVVSADMRYEGQSHELEVTAAPEWAAVRAAFESAHARMFGFDRPDEPVELVNLRAVATGEAPLGWSDLPGVAPNVEPIGRAGVWERPTLPPGLTIEGPATVIEANSAVAIEPGSTLTVLADGTLEVVL